MKLYVAGPMRGKSLYNWPWFKAAAKVLRAKGHEVVSPAEIDEEMGYVFVEYDTDGSIADVRLTSTYDYVTVMERDLAEVSWCDGIVMGPAWETSEGAMLERDTAIAHGLAIFYGVESVPDVTLAALSATAPDPHGVDYPILDRVDMLRHQQRHSHDQSPYNDLALRDELLFDTVSGNEIRVVDPDTGGAKGSKPCQIGWVAPAGLRALGEVAGFGASKYAPTNYRKGFKHSLSFNALLRHVVAYLDGEDIDDESGLQHLAHAAWHCVTLIQLGQDHPELDDRFGRAAAETEV